jgi:ABC-type lipoprotein export system ATPase subunit
MAEEARLPLVEAVAVAKSYGEGDRAVSALKPTTCSVFGEEQIAIVGRSGSGKSTLLHLFAGLDDLTSGKLTWPLLGAKDDLRPGKISVVFQSPSLVPWLNVVENVALPLALIGKKEDGIAPAMAALDRFGLGELAGKLPEELSGGQAQRVALARAIVTKPKLILADEPTGQLDHVTGNAIVESLSEWSKANGCAVVIATHDASVAARMHRVWRMDHGTLTLETESLVA